MRGLALLVGILKALLAKLTFPKVVVGAMIPVLIASGYWLGASVLAREQRMVGDIFLGRLDLPSSSSRSARFLSAEEIDAFLGRQVRDGVRSPLYGLGHVFVEECSKPKYEGRIDPALLVTIAGVESSYGLAYLGTPYWDYHNPFGWLERGHGSPPKRFDSWEEAIRALAEKLWRDYISPGATYREGGAGAGKGSEPGYAIPKNANPVTIEMIGRVYCVGAMEEGGWIDRATSIYRDQLGCGFHLQSGREMRGGEGARETVVNLVKAQIGKPYVRDNPSPPDSFNCSVLVQWVFSQVGLRVIAPSYNQWDDLGYDGKTDNDLSVEVSKDQLQPGDVVFFVGAMGGPERPGHVGIYIGNDQYVHAAGTGIGVVVGTLSSRRDYVGARSFIDADYVGVGFTGGFTGLEDFEPDEEMPEWLLALIRSGTNIVGYLSDMVPPTDGVPLYPLDETSKTCGHWPPGSLDYPYFGAPREGGRKHAGVDIYPPGSEGTPVRAIKEGRVIKVDGFYTRANGEQTYAVMIDHGDFVINYGEIRGKSDAWGPDGLPGVGSEVAKGQVIGYISGTQQLHFEQYASGTVDWVRWYGDKPHNLLDPTALLKSLYYGKRPGRAIVCLDPGHSSTPYEIDPETGLNTQDYVNRPEMEIVFDVSSLVKKKLEERGVKVIMTKNAVDDAVDLKERAEIGNRSGAGMIVHIHSDPSLSSEIAVFYPGAAPNDWKANSETGGRATISPGVQRLSEERAKAIAAAIGCPAVMENRGATGTGNYGPIFTYDIWSRIPTCTIEMRQDLAESQKEAMVEKIVRGILACLGL
ncbi:MAG: NlpC/P60 family protein [Candidatus Hadarchaeales archaeon]